MLSGLHRPTPSPRTITVAALALLAVATFAFAVNPAAAQGNSGTIKVHDGTAADPPTRNEPHVEGDVYVEGFNMAADEGTLRFFSWPPTGDRELVLQTTWAADDGEPEFHFLAGPFELPCGHYRVEAQNGLEEDDFPGGVKSKMFWVECDEPAPNPPPTSTTTTSTAPPTSTTTTSTAPPSCGSPETPPCPPPHEHDGIPCPTDLTATANGDESITLRWTPAPGADGTNIYRAVGGEDFVYITTVGGDVSEWTDTDTVSGNSYAYLLTTLEGNSESTGCEVVEVTAIPVFPTVMAFGLATALGLVAYVALSRRKLP